MVSDADRTMAHLAELYEVSSKLKESVSKFTVNETMVSFVMALPRPAWVKSRSLAMELINPEYTREFDKTIEDYLDAFDQKLWGDSTGDSFQANCRQIIETKEAAIFTEVFYNHRLKAELPHPLMKFPIFDQQGEVAKVGGIILRLPDEQF